MAIKYSVDRLGKTIVIATDGKTKVRKTFASKQEAFDWYNKEFLLNGAKQ